jgi:hypothetical protein
MAVAPKTCSFTATVTAIRPTGSWASIVIDTEKPATIELEHVTVDDQESRGNYPMYVQYSLPAAVTLRIRNCIFAHGGNTFYFGNSVRLDVANTLFYRSADSSLPVVFYQGRDFLPADIARLGPGVFSAAPRFVRRAWGTEGDYRLAPDSPALNRSTVSTLTEDIEGRPRPQGAGFDLGAYEGTAPAATSRLTNLSIRAGAGTGAATLIVGVTIGGGATGATTPVLLRAIGPALTGFGVSDVLADPLLTLFQGATAVASNDNWGGGSALANTFASVGAFGLAPATSKDAALYDSGLRAGGYSMQLTGSTGAGSPVGNATSGVALAEIYDATPVGDFGATAPRLINVSARTFVGTGGGILIAGFAIGGNASVKLLVRAIGPALTQFGVAGVLADPVLELFSGATRLDRNDDWSATSSSQATLTAAFQNAGAFALSPNSKDAALLVTLLPGTYTAQVSAAAGTNGGIALVEVYEVL